MNSTSTIGRIAAVLATVSALTALAGVAQAGTSRPPSMSKSEYQALMLRSEALNQKYGLAAENPALMLRSEALNQKYGLGAESSALMLRSEALNQKYGLGTQGALSQGMTAGESLALRLRSEALNQKYGLGQEAAASVTSQPTSSTRGFAWGAFGIGVALMFGLALLAGGFFVRHPLLRHAPRVQPYRTT